MYFFFDLISVIIEKKNNSFPSGTGFVHVKESLLQPVLLTLHPAPPVYSQPSLLTLERKAKYRLHTASLYWWCHYFSVWRGNSLTEDSARPHPTQKHTYVNQHTRTHRLTHLSEEMEKWSVKSHPWPCRGSSSRTSWNTVCYHEKAGKVEHHQLLLSHPQTIQMLNTVVFTLCT